MKYDASFKWNGKTVLRGQMSAVMAWEILRIMAGQFVNAEKAGFFILPTLVDLANAKEGTVFQGRADDATPTAPSTGTSSFHLLCLEG